MILAISKACHPELGSGSNPTEKNEMLKRVQKHPSLLVFYKTGQ
jgi:hypothetical protein